MQLVRDAIEINDKARELSTEEAVHFVVQLLSVPLAEWTACAMQAATPKASEAARALDDAARLPETMYAAWLIRDHVETASHRFGSADGRRLCPPSRARDLQLATERAALALLLQAWLNDEHFDLLRGGFAALALTPSPSAPPR